MNIEEPAPSFPIHIGRCIYCGRSDVRLSDEHIIPLGLNGEWKLINASCEEHARITSQVELSVLRGALMVPRATLGMRTRRPRERPKELRVSMKRRGEAVSLSVPVNEHPGFFALPVFAPPGNAPVDGPTPGITASSFVIIYRKPTTAAIREKYGVNTFSAPFPDLIAFARLLAKVGYGFAVAKLGVDALLESPALPVILGTDPMVGRFIGCLNADHQTKTIGTHQVALTWSANAARAHVRLFAGVGAPEYIAVLR